MKLSLRGSVESCDASFRSTHNENRANIVEKFQKVSNGFDLRGCVSSSPDGPLLSNEAAFWIGVGFSQYIKELYACDELSTHRIGVGRDPRNSGQNLSAWLISGIETVSGVKAYDIGLCTTPAMYLSCCETLLSPISQTCDDNSAVWPFHGSVSITASHLPSHWNGFKFFTPFHPSNIGEDGISAILRHIAHKQWDGMEAVLDATCRQPHPFLPIYSKFLQNTLIRLIRKESLSSQGTGYSKEVALGKESILDGLKITVNSGNGAGGFLAQCLHELGADTSSSIHLEPDGTFPNHIPNPEDPIAIAVTADATTTSRSHIGICLDCDADRVGIIDGLSGLVINRNNLVALVASIALKNCGAEVVRGTVVTDSATSNGITTFIQNTLNGSHMRYKKGYRYVIEKARSIDTSVVAVECSGHGAWRDNGWVDDGCYTAIRVIAHYVTCNQRNRNYDENGLKALLRGYVDPLESKEFRLRMGVNRELLADVSAKLTQAVDDVARVHEGWSSEPVNYEGIRVNFNQGRGWLMLRPSLHEPILSLHIESEDKGGIDYACRMLLKELNSYHSSIDFDPLSRYISRS